MKIQRTSRKSQVFMKYEEYSALWNIIEGAVVDAMKQHPDYVTDNGRHSMVQSITKRVVGAVIHNAKRTRKGGRLGGCNEPGFAKMSGSHVPAMGRDEGASWTNTCGLGQQDTGEAVRLASPVPMQQKG